MLNAFLYYCGVEDIQLDKPINSFEFVNKIKSTPAADLSLKQTIDFNNLDSLDKLYKHLEQKLGKVVFGQGEIHSPLMIIGDAPQQNTDTPFSHDCLELLEKMFHAIDYPLHRAYQCNLCYQPQDFLNDTVIQTMLPYIKTQINIVSPKILVLMGQKVTQALLNQQRGIFSLRGQIYDYDHQIKAIPIFHPQYLMQQPAHKKLAWQDLQLLQQWLKENA